MGAKFVPEMHDIGKLINDDAIQAALDIPSVVELVFPLLGSCSVHAIIVEEHRCQEILCSSFR